MKKLGVRRGHQESSIIGIEAAVACHKDLDLRSKIQPRRASESTICSRFDELLQVSGDIHGTKRLHFSEDGFRKYLKVIFCQSKEDLFSLSTT